MDNLFLDEPSQELVVLFGADVDGYAKCRCDSAEKQKFCEPGLEMKD
jgi:hypothetical protein